MFYGNVFAIVVTSVFVQLAQLPKIKSCGCRKNALGEKAPKF